MEITDVRNLWEMIATECKVKLNFNVFRIGEEHVGIPLEHGDDVETYDLLIDPNVKHNNSGSEFASWDATRAFPKLTDREHVFYLPCGNLRNDDW
jgi:hypothetical protein